MYLKKTTDDDLSATVKVYMLVIFRPSTLIFIPKLKNMEKSNVTIRKHYATEKIPSVRSLVDVVGSQYAHRQTNMAVVNSSSTGLCPVHWSILFFFRIGLRFVLVPSTDRFHSTVLPASHERTNTHALTRIRTPRPHSGSEPFSTFSVGWAAPPL